MTDLAGRLALVTGGSRGIGRAIVEEFAARGAQVVFTFRHSAGQAEEVVDACRSRGHSVRAVRCDVTDREEVARVVAALEDSDPPLEVVVNNAGVVDDRNLAYMTADQWDGVIATDLTGTFNVSRRVIVPLLKRRRGSVVNISSVAGLIGRAAQSNYAAAKAGVIGFTRSLAKEVARFEVTVNAIAPGFIETEMIGGLTERQRARELEQVPLRRFGQPREVACLAAFLASEQARYVTGQTFAVDGGLSA